jgi:rhodanese-related sulfurtransferase
MELDRCDISRWQLLKQELNNLTPPAFEALRQKPGVVLIDVRTAAEYQSYHFEGAINLDYLAPEFWDRIEQLDPSATYIVYCRSGRRSTRACTLMKNGGFSRIYNLDGGLKAMAETPAN